MKTKPFNTADVQAIMTGRKTMFREVIKPQPTSNHSKLYKEHLKQTWSDLEMGGVWKSRFQVGDIVSVKEAWNEEYFTVDHTNRQDHSFMYKADGYGERKLKWHSPVTMPREAHRLFIKITGVKVERLYDISEEDVIKEGTILPNYAEECITDVHYPDPIEVYKLRHPSQWQSNQWHFAYEFKVVEKP
jgi:hypothetical protein